MDETGSTEPSGAEDDLAKRTASLESELADRAAAIQRIRERAASLRAQFEALQVRHEAEDREAAERSSSRASVVEAPTPVAEPERQTRASSTPAVERDTPVASRREPEPEPEPDTAPASVAPRGEPEPPAATPGGREPPAASEPAEAGSPAAQEADAFERPAAESVAERLASATQDREPRATSSAAVDDVREAASEASTADQDARRRAEITELHRAQESLANTQLELVRTTKDLRSAEARVRTLETALADAGIDIGDVDGPATARPGRREPRRAAAAFDPRRGVSSAPTTVDPTGDRPTPADEADAADPAWSRTPPSTAEETESGEPGAEPEAAGDPAAEEATSLRDRLTRAAASRHRPSGTPRSDR